MARSAVVVGAGIGGLSLAIRLHAVGWRVEVLERWPEVTGVGAALGLWPHARAALAGIGLGELVERESVPAGAPVVYRCDGRVLFRTPARGPEVRLLSRHRLMDLLVRRAAGIEIRTGVTADAGLLHEALAGADLLVGADGVHSGVRAAFLPGGGVRDTGLVGYRGVIEGPCAEFAETWGDGALVGLTPVEGGRTNVYVAVRGHADRPLDVAGLRARFAGWREPVPAALDALRPEGLLVNRIVEVHPRVPRLAAGRVALVGDAAHAMTPHLGRGACEALLDAAALAAELGGRSDVPAALSAYDRRRRRRAQRVAAWSRRVGRVAHATAAAPVRDAALALAAPLGGR